MCFLFLLLFCIIKIKCFFFTFVFLFIWMQVWSLEKGDVPHSSSRVFLHYYNFYFFLFTTLNLVSSFLNLKKNYFTIFPFPCFICFHSFFYSFWVFTVFCLCLFHVLIFSILISSIFIFIFLMRLFICLVSFCFLFQKILVKHVSTLLDSWLPALTTYIVG
jgi:hypothetical protein